MADLTFLNSVEGLRIETDFNDLMIRVFKADNIIRQVNCSTMNLSEYLRTIDEITAKAQRKTDNEN